MKKCFALSVVIAAALVSCQKQQTDAEKDAEVERRVQERLAAERQTQQEQQLAQRQADLDAREKALAEKQNAAAAATPVQSEQVESASSDSESRPSVAHGGVITTGYTTFYNKLDPYGDWIETGDYGYVFHPRQAESSHSWRPYTDGRWVYTDAGWTWISEEPFGWATYHYGRWTRLRGIGWVWVPGNQWAPAWVSWRTSSDYVGWAPLPPEARFDQRTGIRNWSDSYYDVGPDQYCFVASREFGATRVQQTLLPPERNITIINQTTNVTNITYNNTTIVNEGPSYDELRAISREPVQRFRLERNANVDVSAEPPRSQVRGDTVVIAAPVIAAPAANERPTTVKQTVTAAAVDLGWAAIANQDEARKTRQKMKSEATPPPNAPSKKFNKGMVSTNLSSPVAGGGGTSTMPVPSAAMSPVQAPPMATPTPKPAMTPRAMATPTPIPASASPTASQRRGRLLLPTGTPTPNATAVATTTPTPFKRPTAVEEPTAIPPASAGSASQQRMRGKPKSQGQNFGPPNPQPMPSAPSATSTPLNSSAENVTKQEKKEQKREERKALKREREQGLESASPAPSPPP
jgi:hypothetical protein